MAPDGTTSDLAERIRLGDTPAESALVDRFYSRIYAMALARTRDTAVARDLSQEVMLSVLCALREGRLRNHDGLASYICSTARNRISHYFRHRGIRSEVQLPANTETDLPDPESCFQESERRQMARRALERLSLGDRRILHLSYIEGLKPREIAARLALEPEVVRMRKSRALQRARAAIDKEVLRSGG